MLFKSVSRVLLNILLFFSLFVVAMHIAWHLSAAVGYFYKPLYSVMSIQAHIQQYAPQNHQPHLRGFVNTDPEQHVRLFNQIVDAINDNGAGLAEITFYDPVIKQHTQLLTKAEILHLIDVANIVAVFNQWAMACAVVVLLVLGLMQLCSVSLFKLKEVLISTCALVMVSAAVVLLIGAKAVFYYLHEWLFSTNQWFFYYQESLMTTLMKAPSLFGYITIALSVITVLLFTLLLLAIRAGIKRLGGIQR